MPYNKKALSINDCITTLQSMNDFNNEIALLREFLEEEELTEAQSDKLKSLKRLMTLKNTNTKNKITGVFNSLNKLGYY